jgi:poly(3-hydroxybutyrate) depolymerase
MIQGKAMVRMLVGAATGLLLIACAGCPPFRDPTVPGDIRKVSEPALGGDYYLYVPTSYDPAKEWAVVFVCHGTIPFDYAGRQISDWAKLAEEKQFIVAAPLLKGTSSVFPPALPRQVALQREDEQTILACLRHLQGAYNISTDRVFLTGWSAGNFAVLYTGLRNPDVFRALAVLQGNFEPDYLAEVRESIDPFQPVYVLFGSTDILAGSHGKRCVEWLQENRGAVTREEIAGSHKNHPKQAYAFFERVVRKVPWLHIRAVAEDPADPLTARFKVRSSFEPARYQWSFGDGSTSPVASPVHTYAGPGKYTVTLQAETPQEKTVRRAVEIELPQSRGPPMGLDGDY